MKGYYQIRAEKSKRQIIDELNEVNNQMAQELSEGVGKIINTTSAWENKGKRDALIRTRQILSDNNIWNSGF